jgi:hypothetical protein
MTTKRCQVKDEKGEQCRLFEGHRSEDVFVGEPLSLTACLVMQTEMRLAFHAGVAQSNASVAHAILDLVERPCMSKDVGSPGSSMRRANDLGQRLVKSESVQFPAAYLAARAASVASHKAELESRGIRNVPCDICGYPIWTVKSGDYGHSNDCPKAPSLKEILSGRGA